jgi:hypothetical protein
VVQCQIPCVLSYDDKAYLAGNISDGMNCDAHKTASKLWLQGCTGSAVMGSGLTASHNLSSPRSEAACQAQEKSICEPRNVPRLPRDLIGSAQYRSLD